MSFFSNPIVLCCLIAAGIILILIVAVIVCCKVGSDKEREELKSLSEEIEGDFSGDEEVSTVGEDNIENVLSKMQEALEMKEQTAASFEQEQEENAIISFQELLKFKEEQEKLMANTKDNPIEKKKEETKKFSNTEVISPIFGRVEVDEENENHELEKSLNIDPIKKEIKESEDFLNALKDFRKNL